jgi:hypothetical protein
MPAIPGLNRICTPPARRAALNTCKIRVKLLY